MNSESTAPGQGSIAITPSDTVKLTKSIRGIWVGVAGDVSVLHSDGSTGVFKGAAAGTIIPVSVARVNSTGTTATDLVGMI